MLYRFKSPCWYRYIYLNGDSGARHDRVSIRDEVFLSQPVSVPSVEEQEKIAEFLAKIEERISVQNKIIEDLKILKKELCNKVFQSFQCVRLGDYIEEITTRNRSNYCDNVLSVSNKLGFVKQSEQFEDRTIARCGWNSTDFTARIRAHLKKQKPAFVLGVSIAVIPGMTTTVMCKALAMMPWSQPTTTRKV